MKAHIAVLRFLALLMLFSPLIPRVGAQVPPPLHPRGFPNMFPPPPPSILPDGVLRIVGYVFDGSNNPIANVRVNGFSAPSTFSLGYTDTNGLFYMTVQNGTWDVSVDCMGGTNSLQNLGYQCVNDETVVISNTSGTADFITPPQGTAELSGTVSNINGTLISHLTIIATCTTTSFTIYYAQTDWNGFYEFPLPAGDWSVTVDSNSAAAQGYISAGSNKATIGSYPNQFNVDNINFTLPYASPYLPSFAEISGTISNSDGAAVPNLIITATSTIGTNAYSTETDTNGFYEFQLPTGDWEVTVAPQQLGPLGYYITGYDAFSVGDPADEYSYTNANFILFPLPPPIPFFTNQTALGNYAYYLQPSSNNFFGYYSIAYYPYVYHFDLGWEYFVDAQNAANGAYLYDFTSQHWWYTEPGIFPYIYDFTFQAWLYCDPNISVPDTYYSYPRIFYDFGSSNVWYD
jgi:hypothetical protein